nr:MAG TPA: hypothetical protein [Bacteriophage sp.]
MCPDRRVTAKARSRRGLLPVRPRGRSGPDFHPGIISCRRTIRAAARLCRDTASGQASAGGAPVRAHPFSRVRRDRRDSANIHLRLPGQRKRPGSQRERRSGNMSNGYIGKIKSGATQDIKAPHGEKTAAKGTTRITGGDLRTGSKSKSGK